MSLSLSRWVTCQIYHAPTSRAPQTTTESHVHMEARCIPGKHPWSRRAWSRSTHAHLPSGGRCETVCAPLLPHASRSAPGGLEASSPPRHSAVQRAMPSRLIPQLPIQLPLQRTSRVPCPASSTRITCPLICRARLTARLPRSFPAQSSGCMYPCIDKSPYRQIYMSTYPLIDKSPHRHSCISTCLPIHVSTYLPPYISTYPHIDLSTNPHIDKVTYLSGGRWQIAVERFDRFATETWLGNLWGGAARSPLHFHSQYFLTPPHF